MNSIKMMILFLILTLIGSPVWSAVESTPNQGVFTAVDGKVEIKAKKGHKTKKAKKDMTVFEGDRIKAGDKASATLKLFDGSSLEISPKTEFVLSKLQKSEDNGKVFSFKLVVGQLLAAVEKLTTSKSSFEIEAGGVVCGVRGTKFSMNCDGKPKPQVQLHVFEGVVYSIDGHGNKYFFRPGPPIKFTSGTPNQPPTQQQQNPPGGQGNGGNGNNSPGLQDLSGQFHNNVNLNQNKQVSRSRMSSPLSLTSVINSFGT